MKSWYTEIPLWFALIMIGAVSLNAPDRFNYATTKGGRCVTSSNAVDYYKFDTLVSLGYVLKLEPLPIDSFPIQTYTIGQ